MSTIIIAKAFILVAGLLGWIAFGFATIHSLRTSKSDLKPVLWFLAWVAFVVSAIFAANASNAATPDINGDGQVDGLDLGLVQTAWGEATPGNGACDLDGDGDIDGADMGRLLAAWGPLTIAVRSDWGVAGTVHRIPIRDHDADPSPVGPGWTRYAWGWTTTPTGRRERAFAVHMRGAPE